MGTLNQNLQVKASEVLELANALEQAAMNSRAAECMRIAERMFVLHCGLLRTLIPANMPEIRKIVRLNTTCLKALDEDIARYTLDAARVRGEEAKGDTPTKTK